MSRRECKQRREWTRNGKARVPEINLKVFISDRVKGAGCELNHKMATCEDNDNFAKGVVVVGHPSFIVVEHGNFIGILRLYPKVRLASTKPS